MISKKELKLLAQKYGTPLYVFDVQRLRERMEQIKTIVGEEIQLCYSIKANPFLIPELPSCEERLEVCSPGELDICIAHGVLPEKIIYSGVNKGEEDVGRAIRYGVGTCTAESVRQVEMIHKEAVKAGKETGGVPVPVLLRLNSGSQFGMSKEDLLDVIARREEYPAIRIVGIHYFAGTQRHRREANHRELQKLAALYDEILDGFGVRLERLEYGPGLPVPYFEGDDFSDTLEPVRTLKPYLQEFCDRMRQAGRKVRITIEMGRFQASDCGFYLSSVADTKQVGDTRYAILDGGIHQVNYLGQMMGMKLPKIIHLKSDSRGETQQREAGGSKDWCLCGSLCTTSDVLVRRISMEELEQGDIFVFCNVGAYSVTEGMLLFLSRTMPGVVLYRGSGQEELVRGFQETSQLNFNNNYNKKG